MAERVPPGRSGRLWLVAHLASAQRGRDLLDHKHQLLRREHERLSVVVATWRKAWDEALALAQRWSLRAGILGGTAVTALFARAVAGEARVTISYANIMGVSHPDDARCDFPVLARTAGVAANTAFEPAAQAHRDAVTAAVQAAVAETALRRIADELLATRRRLRGIERHRIPALELASRTLQLRLDEIEREEQIVTRMARKRRQSNT